MKVSAIINAKAGSVNASLVESKIRDALFRCDLNLIHPQSIEEMQTFIQQEMDRGTDSILIAGGDGTINASIQAIYRVSKDSSDLPRIALVRSGTANDLASEIGVSWHIDRAARNILEGSTNRIDVIQVEGDGRTAYMLTNGGVGIPAVTAELANNLREALRRAASCPKAQRIVKGISELGYRAIKSVGSGVYPLMVLEALRTWDQKAWGLDISIPGKMNIETQAPIVLVNNQARLGSSFLPAPYTSNTDGTVNLLIAESDSLKDHLTVALQIKKGLVDRDSRFKSFELKEFTLRARHQDGALTFFGDGEILHNRVSEITVRCLARGLPVVVGA